MDFDSLLLKKSRIQFHIESLSPRECSSFVRVRRIIMLKVELKPMNVIHVSVFLFFRWHRTRCVAAYRCGSDVMEALMCALNNRSKHFMTTKVSPTVR